MRTVSISAGSVTLTAELADNETADAIYTALPIKGSANVWGDEIYFGIPVDVDSSDDARDVMEIGELAYWPPGHAFCIFFGRTPASMGDEPRAASPVNPFGRLVGDIEAIRSIRDGATLTIEAL